MHTLSPHRRSAPRLRPSRRMALGLLLLQQVALASIARADPSAGEQAPSLRLRWPGTSAETPPIILSLGPDGSGATVLSTRLPDGTTRPIPVAWPWRAGNVHTLRHEDRLLAGRPPLLLIRALDEGGREVAAAVLRRTRQGALRVLWSGVTRWRGDPGERWRTRLVAQQEGTSGPPRLFVERIDQRHRPCTRSHWVTERHRLDLRTGRLHPVPPSGDWYPEHWEEGRIEALHEAADAAVQARPVHLRLAGEAPARHTSESGWSVPDPVTRHFLIGRLPDAPLWPVEAFLLQLDATGRHPSPDGWLVLAGERGPGLRVPLARKWMGRPLRIQPSEPLPWRCLAVGFAGVRGGSVRLVSLRIITGLERDGAVARLLRRLASPDRIRALDASTRLGRMPAEALAPVLREEWKQLPERTRILALPALVRLLARGGADASSWAAERIPTLLRSLPSPRTLRRALDALGRAGTPGLALLERLTEGDDETARQALAVLAGRDEPEGLRRALRRLTRAEGWKRPALRGALHAAPRTDGHVDVLSAWLRDAPPEAAAAALQALSSAPAWREALPPMLATLFSRADTFESRWRLARAARRLPLTEPVARWLRGLLHPRTPWMLRRAALQALGAAHGLPPAVTHDALRDEMPRVRAAAIRLASEEALPAHVLTHVARGDRWPLVRRAALRRAARRPDTLPLLRAALRDPSRTVRREALERLTERGDRRAWPRVLSMLRDRAEWPDVLVAAVGYARAGCFPDAVDALVGLVARGGGRSRWAADLPVALEAVEALGALGTPDARMHLRRFAPRKDAIGGTARRALERPARCPATRARGKHRRRNAR